MGNFIPVEPEKWAEMVKAAAASDYWRIEAETDHARWLRTLEENEKLRAEVERLTDALNKLVKTPPEATGGVRVKVDFWTQYGSRLPSSYETFWENAAKEGKQS